MCSENRNYESDMTDYQWQLIKPLLPLEHEGPGRPIKLDMRQVVNAIFYVLRAGCQWENLPKNYPNHNSIYYHYRKWSLDGTWAGVNEALRQQERERQGRQPEPSASILDSQSVKTTEALTPGKRSKEESDISLRTRLAICSRLLFTRRISKTGMGLNWCWKNSVRARKHFCLAGSISTPEQGL